MTELRTIILQDQNGEEKRVQCPTDMFNILMSNKTGNLIHIQESLSFRLFNLCMKELCIIIMKLRWIWKNLFYKDYVIFLQNV